ncbi:winged helix-turn-helix domain-containing protein [Clostridium sp. WILCCON 0269]|uniref:Winged helix-turn-helix domain-containing protein n=1 Tax=Candidatus Clostridium eludens TaxID=3381663 RepID=A0ABW8SRF1_9CLOT
MTPEEDKEFLEHFREQALAGEILEVSEIITAYSNKLNKKVSKSIVYDLSHRNGWRKVMPRSKHPNKADDEAIEAYKKMLGKADELEKYRTRVNKSFRLMFQDEVSFGRINKPKRCWCKGNIRPTVPCHRIREYTYAYGAVSPLDGDMVSLVLPRCNTECMNIFLAEVSNQYPDDYILMVTDNAG